MKSKRKTLVCIILVAVVFASLMAVGIHQYVNRPQKIDIVQFEENFSIDTYTRVHLKVNWLGAKAVAIDHDGNKYCLKVEDVEEFNNYVLDAIVNFDVQTTYTTNIKPSK